MDSRRIIAERIKEQLKNTSHSEYTVNDIITAIRILEGRIYRTMVKGESFGFKKVLSIFPDPGSISARIVMRKIANRRKRRQKLFASRKKKVFFGIKFDS